jgi:hypothetical protein
LKDISEYIFAGEVPPNEMYKLLTEEWKIPENLSLALMSLYGGHIYSVYRALESLMLKKKAFVPLDPNTYADIQKCFKEDVDTNILVEKFKLLAEVGFAPLLEREEPVAEVLSRNNVAGVVPQGSLMIGLRESVWTTYRCKFGLVPSSQSIRLSIAEYLYENEYV